MSKFTLGILGLLIAFAGIATIFGAEIPLPAWIALGYVTYTITTSYIEAVLFHYRNMASQRIPKYEHIYLTLNRLTLFGAMYYMIGWMPTVGCIFVFPFLHDGAYYAFRNEFDDTIYKYGFWSNPEVGGNTSYLDFSIVVRSIMALGGLSLIIVKTFFL